MPVQPDLSRCAVAVSNHQEDDLKKAKSKLKSYALKQLARREHTQLELHNKLATYAQKLNSGSPTSADCIDSVISELTEKGYQCNTRAGEALLRSALHKGQGKQRIIHELRQRGAPVDALMPALHSVDWLHQAVQARQKRFGVQPPTEAKARAKQLRFLYHRGFCTDICYQAVAQPLQGVTTLHDLPS